MPLIITLIAGLFILLGAVAIKFFKETHKVEVISFALALGALVSLMIFDLIPDMFEGEIKWYLVIVFVVVGFGLLFLLDILAPDHEDHHDTEENHDEENSAHIGIMSALAVILHNIVEGMTVYTMSMDDAKQGLILAIGIGLHNIPMGMLIFSTLAHKSKKDKYILTSAVVLSTPIGGLLMMLLSGLLTETIIAALVCVAAGMIVYLVAMELAPHVIKTKPAKLSVIGSITGFVVVLISCLLG
ncbi:MAG: ZIP family metal transporter [Saccharofermentans sp.]|nr:ZIP family metal transporter [Saccharofermentans sp.]